jgi:predicted RNase H-like nuclease (RuvC/YqgF family)
MTDEEIKKLKEEINTWKEASSANSYKAFQLQEENKILSKHILELQKDKGELTDKCREIEAQIEKLKCCQNCKYFDKLYNRCEKTLLTMKSALCNSLDKWEIKEK